MPTYRLVEIGEDRRQRIEEFEAPNDKTALERIDGEPRASGTSCGVTTI